MRRLNAPRALRLLKRLCAHKHSTSRTQAAFDLPTAGPSGSDHFLLFRCRHCPLRLVSNGGGSSQIETKDERCESSVGRAKSSSGDRFSTTRTASANPSKAYTGCGL